MNSSYRIPIHLVAWSGGLDSTYLLWDLIRQGHVVCAEHMEQTEAVGRRAMLQNAQWDAIRHLAPQLRLCSMSKRNVEDGEKISEHDILWTVGVAIRDCLNGFNAWPHYWYVGVRSDENRKEQLLRQAEVRKLWSMWAPPGSEAIVPAIAVGRREIWDQLPQPIRECTWSCRMPKLHLDHYVACGVCRACKELLDAGIPLQREIMAS